MDAKFIVLGDLHLGIKFHKRSLLEDQAHVLFQITEYLEEHRANLVIAGDVFDTTNPPIDAQNLWMSFLLNVGERNKKWNTRTYIIPGNHDSAARLALGREFMKDHNIFIADPFDPWCIWPIENRLLIGIPFTRPSSVDTKLGIKIPETVGGYDKAYEALLNEMVYTQGVVSREDLKKAILVAHQTFEGARRSESEFKPFMQDAISTGTVSCFDAVWAGHLHAYQKIDNVFYTGSLLPYAFGDEWNAGISLWRVTSDDLSYDRLPIKPLRPLKQIAGNLAHCLTIEAPDAYVKVKLVGEEHLESDLEQLQNHFPYLCCVVPEEVDRWEADLDKPVGNFSTIQEAIDAFCDQIEVPRLEEQQLSIIEEALDAYSKAQSS